MNAVERTELQPGYAISRLIKGGWQLAGGHGPVGRAAALEEMRVYLRAGIVTFDCADIYTGVEELIGAFRLETLRRDGAAALAALKVHTKFVPDLSALGRIDRRGVAEAIDRSLRRLGVERLDLVQFHWWDYGVPRFVEVALWLVELQRAGKIELIGGTNFDVPATRALLEADVPLASMQVQYSLLDSRPENGLAQLCGERGVRLLCYGTLAGGFLSEGWLGKPEPAGPLENRSLTKYKLIIDEFGGWSLFQLLLRTLRSVADRHGASIGEIAMRAVLDRPQVAAIIVGVRHGGHLAAHRRVFGLRLDDEDREAIAAALAGRMGPAGDVYALERDRGGRHGRIMKYDLSGVGDVR